MSETAGQGEDMSLYPVLKELGDTDLVPGRLGEITDGHGLVTVADADELFTALCILAVDGIAYNPRQKIFEKVGHEYQHATAARLQMLEAIHAIRFKRQASGNLGMKPTTVPFGDGISKLGFVSMIAYPKRLSNSDLRKIQFIGYDDAEDVAARIVRSGLDLPIPLSVQL
jgi:hypothetical protein